MITTWVQDGTPFDLSLTVITCFCTLCALVVFFVSVFGMVFGKYPRKTLMLFSFAGAAAYAAEIIHQVIAEHFDAQRDAAILAMLAVFGVLFILTVVFAAVSVRREDKEEDMLIRHGGEI